MGYLFEHSIFYPFYVWSKGGVLADYGHPFIPSMLMDAGIFLLLAGIPYILILLAAKPKRIHKALAFAARLIEKKGMLCLILLFALSLLLRLVYLNDSLFHHDAVQLAYAVQNSVADGTLHGTVGGKQGFVLINVLLSLPLHYLFRIPLDATLNAISALFGAGAVITGYWFAREFLGDKKQAILAALLFSIAPVFFSISTYAQSHSMAVFFALLSGYFLLRGIKEEKRWQMAAFGITFGFSCFVRVTNLIYLIPFGFLYFFSDRIMEKHGTWKDKFSAKALIWFCLPLGAMLLLLAAVQWGIIFSQLGSNPSASGELVSDRLWYSFNYLLKSLTVPGLLIALGMLAMGILKGDRFRMMFYMLWIAPFFLYLGSTLYTAPRLMAPIIFPLMMLVAQGTTKISRRPLHAGMPLFIVILLIMILTIYPIVSFREHYSGPKVLAEFIRKNTESTAVILANDDGVLISYYGNRSTMGYPLYGGVSEVRQAIADLVFLLENNIPVYVNTKMMSYAGNDMLGRTLSDSFELEEKGSMQKITIRQACDLTCKKMSSIGYAFRRDSTKRR